MRPGNKNRTIHTLFDLSVLAKGLDGLLEIAGGLLLLFVHPDQISEDPRDLVANLLIHSVQHLSSNTKVFAAVFLLGHGLVKVGLVWALLKKHRWAYPLAIVAFGMFVLYQLYRYSNTHSIWLLALSLMDVAVVVLTWLEYRRIYGSRRDISRAP
jgi:uncharacterized membrane protein